MISVAWVRKGWSDFGATERNSSRELRSFRTSISLPITVNGATLP